MNIKDLVEHATFWLGSIALVLALLWCLLWVLCHVVDLAYQRGRSAAEFMHWFVARRVLRKRRKKWLTFDASGKPDPNGEYVGPNRNWNEKALGPHPEREKASKEWRENILARLESAERRCRELTAERDEQEEEQ